MNTLISDKIQHFFEFHPAFQAMEVLLLIALGLGVLGQWSLLFILIGMVIIVSINVLIFSTLYQTHRNAGSDDNHLPYSCMLHSLVDPHTSRLEHERIERQAEEFKPFVFKHYPEDSRHA